MIKAILKTVWPYLVIVLLGFAVWESNHRAYRYQQLSDTFEETISDLDQKIQYTQLQLNDSVSLYQAEVRDLSYSKDNLEAKYNNLLAASKLKSKDVNTITEITSVIHQIDTVIAEVDSFGGIRASVQDPFINIDVEVMPNRNTVIDYAVKDSLTVINVQKKHSWLFGLIKWKEHKDTRVINHNPKATITNLQTIDVLE